MVFFLVLLACTDTKEKTEQVIVQVDDWCDAGLGGHSGTRAWQQDFARAHVGHRLFGPQPDWVGADEILSAHISDSSTNAL